MQDHFSLWRSDRKAAAVHDRRCDDPRRVVYANLLV